MTSFGRYLTYRLKKSVLGTLIFSVVALLMTNLAVRNALNNEHSHLHTGLHIYGVILGIICTLIPMMENACFKNRRNLDTLYFLPISRFKMALAHYLSGWIQVTVIYTVSFVWGTLLLFSRSELFHLFYLLPYYFLSLLIGLMMYSVFSLLFGEGNTEWDGITFSVLGIFVLMLIFEAIGTLVSDGGAWSEKWNFVDPTWGIVYMPISNLTDVFQVKLHVQPLPEYEFNIANSTMNEWYMFVVWGVIGVASAIGYFRTFMSKRAEKIGDISNSWFGYKTLIPIYAYSLFFLLGEEGSFLIFIFIMMFAGYFIYRRSFRLKASDLLMIALSFIPIFAHFIFT